MEERQSSRLASIFRNLLFSMFNKEFLIFLFFLLLSGAFWLVMTLNETYERGDTTVLARISSNASCLENAGGPKPFVNSRLHLLWV